MHDSQYMDRYRMRLHETSELLETLMNTILATLGNSAPDTLITFMVREPLWTRIKRKLKIIQGPRLAMAVTGFSVPDYDCQQLILTRIGRDGRAALGSWFGGHPGAFTKYDASSYLIDILSDDRWVSLQEYERRFVHLYETLATTFLPESHDLQKTAKALREAITPEKKPAEDGTVAEAAPDTEEMTRTA